MNIPELCDPLVLNGSNVGRLATGGAVYRVNGLVVGLGTDEGFGYPHPQQDRIAVVPGHNRFAVMDGVGSEDNAAFASQTLGESFVAHPTKVGNAIDDARRKLGSVGKTIFATVRILGDSLFSDHMGDCRVIVIGEHGDIRFATKDETKVQQAVDAGFLTADEALLSHYRHKILRSVNGRYDPGLPSSSAFDLLPGDLVILSTDGVNANLTDHELAFVMRGARRDMGQALGDLGTVVMQRMVDSNRLGEETHTLRRAKGRYSDGFRSPPKRDHRSIIAISYGG